MNKTAIKNFAIWARVKLMSDVKTRLGFVGITENGVAKPLPSSTKEIQYFESTGAEPLSITGSDIGSRKRIVEQLELEAKQGNYKTAFETLVENTASAWFNRLIAIRFMEVNGYISDGIRMLSSTEKGKQDPDIVTTPFDSDLDFTEAERQEIIQAKLNNETDKVFRTLFFKRCHQLHKALPGLFEDKGDATEFLMRLSVIDTDGVIYHLVHDIDEGDFNVSEGGQVEIIGWLYQYYNSEPKNQIINVLKGLAIRKEDIPAATQLFTTDWVVRYIVDNTVGRYWIERHPESSLADKLTYFVKPKNGNILYLNESVKPEELDVLDNCMGSGHFLVYAMEVLMLIYEECGYEERDAAQLILEKNIAGLDIDQRAYQLAYFAVMMKARQYDRRILSRGITPKVYAIEESNSIDKTAYAWMENEQRSIAEYLCDVYLDAKEYGSIVSVENRDYERFIVICEEWIQSHEITLDSYFMERNIERLIALAKQAQVMSSKYKVVVTNPPYMNRFDPKLKTYINCNYKDYSGDLFSVFMIRNFENCEDSGYTGFMTPFVWMFIRTYEKLRKNIVEKREIVSLIQMEYSAFEEATVPICSFVMRNRKSGEKGVYFRLTDFRGGMNIQKQKALEALNDANCGYLYEIDQSNFIKISGMPIAYWLSNAIYDYYEKSGAVSDVINSQVGTTLGDNAAFLRMWFEVEKGKTHKWIPSHKGGGFRRWYGNNTFVVNWENNGKDVKEAGRATVRGEKTVFKKGIAWTQLTAGSPSFRVKKEGEFVESASCVCQIDDNKFNYLLAFLNSVISSSLLDAFNPTMHFQPGDIGRLPWKYDETFTERINQVANDNINLTQYDWDAFELSWDFKEQPFVRWSKELWDATAIGATMQHYYGGHPKVSCPLELCYMLWQGECNERFKKLKENEEELNRIFIEIYGLQGELSPEIEDKDITVRKADLGRDIRSLLSYAIGCMFGRYSLTEQGLIFAGGEWKDSRYGKYQPDSDNIIPILDTAYFEDDIVKRIEEFISFVFGEDSLEANLTYIAKALDAKSVDARQTIREYFLNDFFKDHCSTYSVTGSGKRPIYWLFDSGKQNGFKALVYMHRWNADIEARVRALYLHKVQEKYENEIKAIDTMIEHMTDSRMIAKEEKRKEKLKKQIAEVKDYDEILDHIANEHIDIDLDDGVKVNYEKVQTDHNGKKYKILAPIK